MPKKKSPNSLRLRNSTAEFLTFAYRVNSGRATAFRQWATGVLRDYTLRGYVMAGDDE